MLVAPVASEVLGKLPAGLLAPSVAQIPKRPDGPGPVLRRQSPARSPSPLVTGQIGDRTMDLDVHLIQRLLHPLDKTGELSGPQSAQLPVQGPEPDDHARADGRIPAASRSCAATESTGSPAGRSCGPERSAASCRALTSGAPRCRRIPAVRRAESNTRWCSPSPPTPPLAPATSRPVAAVAPWWCRRCARSLPWGYLRSAHPVLPTGEPDRSPLPADWIRGQGRSEPLRFLFGVFFAFVLTFLLFCMRLASSAAITPARVGVVVRILASRRASVEASLMNDGLLGPRLILGARGTKVQTGRSCRSLARCLFFHNDPLFHPRMIRPSWGRGPGLSETKPGFA